MGRGGGRGGARGRSWLLWRRRRSPNVAFDVEPNTVLLLDVVNAVSIDQSENTSRNSLRSVARQAGVVNQLRQALKKTPSSDTGSGIRGAEKKSKKPLSMTERRTMVKEASQNFRSLKEAKPSLFREALGALSDDRLRGLAEALDSMLEVVAATRIQARFRSKLAKKKTTLRVLTGGKQRRSIPPQERRCIVFGSLNMDLKAETAGSWPRAGSINVGEFSMSPGGKGANEAVALCRLGVPTCLVGRVGKDEMGRALMEHLQSKAYPMLDSSNVRLASDAATGVALQFVTSEDGQKGTVVCQGANGSVSDAEVQVRTTTPHSASHRPL